MHQRRWWMYVSFRIWWKNLYSLCSSSGVDWNIYLVLYRFKWQWRLLLHPLLDSEIVIEAKIYLPSNTRKNWRSVTFIKEEKLKRPDKSKQYHCLQFAQSVSLASCITLNQGLQTFSREGHIADILKTRGPKLTQIKFEVTVHSVGDRVMLPKK